YTQNTKCSTSKARRGLHLALPALCLARSLGSIRLEQPHRQAYTACAGKLRPRRLKMARLVRLDHSGHTELAEWSAGDRLSYERAAELFQDQLGVGYMGVAK